jgi:hypothetical protein
MSDPISDFFTTEPKAIRAKIRSMMPPDCKIDEIDWLELQSRKASMAALLSKEPFPENEGTTFQKVIWKP